MDQLRRWLKDKKHVIWDWNGTLLDDLNLCLELITEIAARHGVTSVTMDSYLEHFSFPVIDYYKKLGMDVGTVSFEAISREFFAAYRQGLHRTSLHHGMPELIASLSESGIQSSILSAAKEDDLQEILARFQIDHLFTHVYGIDDHLAHGKIERGRQLKERLGLPASSLIMIGDTDHDADVADALGIDVILLEGGHQAPHRLRSRHHHVLSR